MKKTRTANLHHLYHEPLPENLKLTPKVEVDNVHQRQTTDVYEHALTITAWQQIYDQLHPGKFHGEFTEILLDDIQVFREYTGLALRQSCLVWPNSFWFGIPATRGEQGFIGSQCLGSAEIATRPGGTEFELSTPDDYTILGVVLSEDVITRQANFLHNPDRVLHMLRNQSALEVKEQHKAADTIYGVIDKFNIPTQGCVLAHVTTQIEAIRRGAPGGLIFQSICGSEKGLKEFGVELAMLDEARAVGAEFNRIAGENCLYFETGQGSALSAGANFGADQVTMEARNYGLARHYDPFIVNTVVGFIGPEYLYNDRQIIRAGLEDHFMGKLSGISMGCDCCYTNHADADQNLNENLMILLATAGCNYIMGMPLGDDIMLNYQTTAFHDTATVRQLLNLRPSPEFERWLESMGIMANGRLTKRAGDPSLFF
ncbi:HTH-type transcriptional regulator EutR [Escherichia coli]|nr:HTH-type transcriptional regulator EutR [Escherichia coli]